MAYIILILIMAIALIDIMSPRTRLDNDVIELAKARYESGDLSQRDFDAVMQVSLDRMAYQL